MRTYEGPGDTQIDPTSPNPQPARIRYSSCLTRIITLRVKRQSNTVTVDRTRMSDSTIKTAVFTATQLGASGLGIGGFMGWTAARGRLTGNPAFPWNPDCADLLMAIKPVTFGFAEWRPDLANINAGLETALNVIPVGDGYIPMPQPVPRGPNGLPGIPELMLAALTADGINDPLVFTRGRIYRATAGQFVDISRSGGYTQLSAAPWSFQEWGSRVYAVNGIEPLQRCDIGSGAFDDVAGLPDNLTAAYIGRVHDFLVLGDIRSSEGNFPTRFRWSQIGRPENFTPSLANQSSFVDRPNIGNFRGLVSGDYGLILGSKGMDRVDYIGPPLVFQFTTVETDVGCEIPRSLAQVGTTAIWYSARGWRMSTGGPSQSIGLDKIDNWFSDRIDRDHIDRMTGTVLLREQCVLYHYVSNASPDGEPDEVLCFNISKGEWTRGNFRASIIGRSVSPDIFTDSPPPDWPIYTDDIDIITDAFSDSDTFPAAIVDGSLNILQAVDGAIAEFTLEEKALIPARKARATRVMPLIDGAPNGFWLYVLTRDTQGNSAYRQTGPYVPEDDGTIAIDDAGRFHMFNLHVRTPFNRAMGLLVTEIVDTGMR
jgi:hypothetical protein